MIDILFNCKQVKLHLSLKCNTNSLQNITSPFNCLTLTSFEVEVHYISNLECAHFFLKNDTFSTDKKVIFLHRIMTGDHFFFVEK